MRQPTRFASQIPCKLWEGDPNAYQKHAADAFYISGRDLQPWDWVTPMCQNPLCIEPEHLAVQANVKLRYPHSICIYCGRPGYTKDHLLPRNWTGEAQRHFVVTVPACRTCNTLLRDTLTWSITERRALAHERLRKHYAKVLRTVDRTPEELNEYGPTLRSVIVDGMERKAEVLRMLDWPEDPAYDARALAHSGIDDPWAIGLLLPDTDDLAAHVVAVA
nr:MAG TPA: HNH endonuclease [Caudoviricetes sp.]